MGRIGWVRFPCSPLVLSSTAFSGSQRCKMFLENTMVNIPATDVQADEIWSFVYCKEKTHKKGFERFNKLALASGG